MVNKVAQPKRKREEKFQTWLDRSDDQHAFVLDLIKEYREKGYKTQDILVKMAYALNETGDISIAMPENSSWLESAVKTLMTGMSALQDMLKSGSFTVHATHEDRQRVEQIHSDMDEMQESIAARYHAYTYDPSEDNGEEDF